MQIAEIFGMKKGRSDLRPRIQASEKEMEADRQYFMKKMGWSEEKFKDYMIRPKRPHTDYPSEVDLYQKLIGFYRKFNLKFGRLTWR